jgi:release factor glutamine methyltransferase
MQPRKADRPGRPGTAASLLDEGELRLRASTAIDHWRAGIARHDAEDLLAIALDVKVEEIEAEAVVKAAPTRRYREFVRRRATGEPVALIRGQVVFAGLVLGVRPGVFVPRGSSELLADTAIAAIRGRRRQVAVDVACGAAPVACAIAAALPRAQVWGVDIAADAVALARANARRNCLGNARFRVSDVLDGLPASLRGQVGVFSVHPPYVGRDEVRGLPREIRRFEPRHTLTDGSDDGLELVRRLLADAPDWLRPRGQLAIEVAPYLSRSVQALLRRGGFEVSWRADPDGVTRVVSGRRPG